MITFCYSAMHAVDALSDWRRDSGWVTCSGAKHRHTAGARGDPMLLVACCPQAPLG